MALQDLTPQLRTRLLRVEKIVGLFVILATLLLLTGFVYYLYHTAQRKGWFTPKAPYHTFIKSGEGLAVGAPVTLMGFKVGEVTEITAQPPGSWYKVFVAFEIKQPYYGYIWSDSKVKIIPADFLGSRQLEVVAGVAGKPTVYETNNHITGVLEGDKTVAFKPNTKGFFLPPLEEPALTERAAQLVSQLETALPNVLSLTNQVYAVLTNTVQTTTHINTLLTAAQPILTNAAAIAANAVTISSNAVVITGNLRDPHGSLGEWAIPTNLNADLHATLSNVNSNLTATLTTLDHVAAITSNLNTQVQANDQILAEISRLIVNSDNLVQGLKKHWLLRGVFTEKAGKPGAKPPAPTSSSTKTNAPGTNFGPR